MIEAAGGRIGGTDLRHRHCKDQRDEAADRPADADPHAAGARRGLGKRVDAARQDTDDREGNGEVGEAAEAP